MKNNAISLFLQRWFELTRNRVDIAISTMFWADCTAKPSCIQSFFRNRVDVEMSILFLVIFNRSGVKLKGEYHPYYKDLYKEPK